MAKTEVPIFGKDDYDRLIGAKRRLSELLPLFDLADECGTDCQELRSIASDMLSRLDKIQANFMTPEPKG